MTGLISVAGSTPSDEGFELKSLRWEADDAPRLQTDFATAGNRRIWTFSVWIKRGNIPTDQLPGNYMTFLEPTGGDRACAIVSTADLGSTLYFYEGGGSTFYVRPQNGLNDAAAWYHIVLRFDTTQATAADRIRWYINGVSPTNFDASTYPSQNYEGPWNNSGVHWVGQRSDSRYFDGYMAEFYFVDGQSLGPEAFAQTNEDTQQWEPLNPVDIKPTLTFGTNGFYLPFSNEALATSFTDAADRGVHTMVVGGNTHTDTTTKKIGTASAEFDGTGDYLYVADSNTTATTSDFVFTGDFTVECWVYPASGGSGENYLISHWKSGAYSSGGPVLQYDHASNQFAAWVNFSTSAGGTETFTQSGTSAVDAWYHVALTRSGNVYRFYLDGVEEGNATNAGTIVQNSAVYLSIGAGVHTGGASYYTTGFIDEVRISDTARYTSAFTPSTIAFTADANTLLLLHMDGANDGTTFTDSSWTESGPRHPITVVGDTKNVRVSNHPNSSAGHAHIIGPKTTGYSSSIFFGEGGASGNYISAAASSEFEFGSTDPFTIEFWCNMTRFPSAAAQYFITCTDTFRIAYDTTYSFWRFVGGSNSDTWAPGAGQPHLYEWIHVAMVGDGTNVKGYVGGIERVSFAQAGTAGATGTTFKIGIYDGSSHAVAGYMEEIRLSNVARYTAAYTPSADPFTSDANTLLLIESNTTMSSTTFTDSSSSSHTITASGDAVNVAPKIGTGMAAFDGTGDYATLPHSLDWDVFASGSVFTLEAWIRCNTVPDNSTYFDWFCQQEDASNGWRFGYDQSAGAGGGLWIWMKSGGSTVVDFSTYYGTSGGPIADTDWHHIAMTKNGDDYLAWLDGTKVVDGSDASSDTFVAPLGIAGYSVTPAANFDGCMDEVRITHGLRYTAASPPVPASLTTAFKDDKDTVLLMHMDGGGNIVDGVATAPGEGTYFFDDSTNAIFYDSATGVPTNKSIISFDGSGDELTCPDSSDWNFGADPFTLELWFNISSVNEDQRFFGQYEDTNNRWYFGIHSADRYFQIYSKQGGTIEAFYTSANGTYEYNTWHHAAFVRDGTNVYLFVDGVSKTLTTVGGADIGTDPWGDDAAVLRIGQTGGGATEWLNGDADQFRISNSARYTSGFTPPTTPFTTDANTKLLIQSDFSEGGPGADHSGNYNYFTPRNIVASDVMPDSPVNNFCVMNPNDLNKDEASYRIALNEGNLRGNGPSEGRSIRATFGVPTGKWYWEMCVTSAPTYCVAGIAQDASSGWYMDGVIGVNAGSYGFFSQNGEKFNNNTSTAYGSTWNSVGDICGVAFDADGGTLTYYVNGVSQGSAFTGITGGNMMPAFAFRGGQGTVNFGQDQTFSGSKTGGAGASDGNSKGEFFYTPPAGYLALCEDNLSTPAIELPGEHFNTILRNGFGSSGGAVTGVGFEPDFLWQKARSGSGNHWLTNSVSGDTKYLWSNANAAEATNANFVASLDSDGFTMGSDDWGTGTTTVGWNWKAGGSGSANTDGTINSTVSVNASAGFSAVKYEGNNTSGATVGHGLSVTPELVIIKNVDAAVDWIVYSETVGATAGMQLNGTGDPYTYAAYFNNTAPTASVFSLGDYSGVNANTQDMMAYCFHSVEGYSKVSSYRGTGVTGSYSGPFVYTGFRPAYILIKSTASGCNWVIFDDKRIGYNPENYRLEANDTDIEHTTDYVDFMSNGFKLISTHSDVGTGGDTYIYYAVAKSPFKYANAYE